MGVLYVNWGRCKPHGTDPAIKSKGVTEQRKKDSLTIMEVMPVDVLEEQMVHDFCYILPSKAFLAIGQ